MGIFISNTHSLHCLHQNDCIKVGSCVSHFNVLSIVWAKSQDSVHKPQESRSGSNQGPSAYQPSALLLGHTGSPPQKKKRRKMDAPSGIYTFHFRYAQRHRCVHAYNRTKFYSKPDTVQISKLAQHKHTHAHIYTLTSE